MAQKNMTTTEYIHTPEYTNEEYIEILESLLENTEQVLNAIPPCPMHGRCIPHALEWIEEAKRALTEKET